MFFFGFFVTVILILMKVLGVAFMVGVSWWVTLIPILAAVVVWVAIFLLAVLGIFLVSK